MARARCSRGAAFLGPVRATRTFRYTAAPRALQIAGAAGDGGGELAPHPARLSALPNAHHQRPGPGRQRRPPGPHDQRRRLPTEFREPCPQPFDELPPEPWEPPDDPESCELPEDPEPWDPEPWELPEDPEPCELPETRSCATSPTPTPSPSAEPDFELDELELEADEPDFEPELLDEVDFELERDFEPDSCEEPEDWCEELDCCEDVELLERPVTPADCSRDCTRALIWLASDPPLDVEREDDVVSPEPPRSGEDRAPDRARGLESVFHADAAREPPAEELSSEPLRVAVGRSAPAEDVESCVPLAPAPVLVPSGSEVAICPTAVLTADPSARAWPAGTPRCCAAAATRLPTCPATSDDDTP